MTDTAWLARHGLELGLAFVALSFGFVAFALWLANIELQREIDCQRVVRLNDAADATRKLRTGERR